jgi:hypothetical protein
MYVKHRGLCAVAPKRFVYWTRLAVSMEISLPRASNTTHTRDKYASAYWHFSCHWLPFPTEEKPSRPIHYSLADWRQEQQAHCLETKKLMTANEIGDNKAISLFWYNSVSLRRQWKSANSLFLDCRTAFIPNRSILRYSPHWTRPISLILYWKDSRTWCGALILCVRASETKDQACWMVTSIHLWDSSWQSELAVVPLGNTWIPLNDD